MKSDILEHEKQSAAYHATALVEDGMIVGLGSGSTAAHMIQKLGERVRSGLEIVGVPSSEKTALLAQKAGIPLTALEEVGQLDINIDGADEFDKSFRLIKGGGGALLREKILAHNSARNIIISDSSKKVERLGAYKLPLETIPFATKSIMLRLNTMGLRPILRQSNGKIFSTDEQNYIIDVDVSNTDDLEQLNRTLLEIPGLVETGLFLSSTDVIIMGKGDKIVVYKSEK